MPDDGYGFVAAVATIALNAGLALQVGAIASLIWCRRFQSSWSFTAREQAARYLGLGIGVVVLANGFDLWLRSAAAAEVSLQDAWPAAHSMLMTSHYGRAWAAGMVALVVGGLMAGVGLARRGAWQSVRLAITVACIAVFVHARSSVSHASADGAASVAVAVEWIHLVLIALWVGMVFVTAVTNFQPDGLTVEGRRHAAAWLRSLSRTATFALAGVLATGLFNLWRATEGRLGQLPGSDYGLVLFVKLFFVVASIALGAHNRFRSLPGLLAGLEGGHSETRTSRRFVTVIRLEAFTLATALAAAAVLSSAEPPIV